jgi:catechol 2,3-dioxygenase
MEVENVPLFGTRSPRRPNRAYVPAMGILRLSHVDITVPDLDLAAAYYTGVIGMDMTDQVDDRLFFKCWDEEDHHSLAVRFDPRVGIDRFAFKVEREDDLDDLERKVESYGFAVSRVSRGEEVGQGESIRFATPSGHEMELVYEVDRLGSKVGKLNPEYRIDNPGIAPPRMDHMLINAEEVGEATKFFMDVLGFRLTEQLIDAEGHQIGTWLERSHRPHDIAIVSGPNGALHHFAYWLDDWDHVRQAADILAYNAIAVDVGPTRHGITRGNTIYFFDPMGTRNEVFTGGYRPDPDFPTITWTEDNIGKAVFYYEGEINDRFISVHT